MPSSSQNWVELIEGDALEVVPTLSEKADLVVADPPYGDTSLTWDRDAARGWLPTMRAALKPNGAMWVFGSMRYLGTVWAEIEAAGFKYSQDIVWEKQNGTGFHADRFRRVHEHVVLFYLGAWKDTFHEPQYTNDARKTVARRKTRPTHTGHIERGHYQSYDGGPRLMRSVLEIPNMHGKALHPTQKPETLVELLIRYACPEGGLVLSPFGGSGTDAIAARNTGRNCVCIEKEREYYEIAEHRLWPDA